MPCDDNCDPKRPYDRVVLLCYGLYQINSIVKSVLILIFNSEGRIALQLRAANDRSYPLHWDFSAGGDVESGEDAFLAAEREVQEELGVRTMFTEIDRFSYADIKAHQSSYSYNGAEDDDTSVVFKGQFDGVFSPSENEVQSIRLITIAQLEDIIRKGEKFHPEFLYFLTERFLKK